MGTRNFVLLTVLILGLSGQGSCLAGEEFDQGVAALEAGDYATALKLIQPLAEAGLADAQFKLGMMFENGLGVPPDPEQAEQWYNRACPVPVQTDPQ